MDNDYLTPELRALASAIAKLQETNERIGALRNELCTIEEMYRQLEETIRLCVCRLLGYVWGDEMFNFSPHKPSSPIPTLYTNHDSNGYQGIILPKTLIDEVKEMMIELKIKGSVRERNNGLIELRTQALGSIYGRSKEEIEQKPVSSKHLPLPTTSLV